MRVAVTLEHRFTQSPDGAVWSRTMFSHRFFRRYLQAFDQVVVVARALPVPAPPVDGFRVDGPGVTFVPLPHYIGPTGFLRCLPQLRHILQESIHPEDATILRVSSPIGGLVQPTLLRRGQPYAVEVVGDPYDVFAPGASNHPLRVFFRQWSSQSLRKHCWLASAAAYVTQRVLQLRYPPGPATFSTSYSSVELPKEAFVSQPMLREFSGRRPRLLTVGTLSQRYKGVDVLLDAVAICRRRGCEVTLTIVGDGKHRGELEQQAHGLKIDDVVSFAGMVPCGPAVREQLDYADLFALPSRTEGLPRAIIEAMARALPCIGSTVGGIPELLDANDLVPCNDAEALARKIMEVIQNPNRRREMAARNLERSWEYRDEVLNVRRRQFYQYVREIAEQRPRRKAA